MGTRSGSFDGAEDGDCENACNVLNGGRKGTFARNDYCPGGTIYNAAQKCKKAKKSLDDAFPADVCKHQDSAVATCDWHYSYQTNDENFTMIEGGISKSFDYTPSPECADACAALGYYNNMPADYCEGTPVWKTVQKCDAAADVLSYIKAQKSYKVWCDPSKSVRVSSDVAIDYKVSKPSIESKTSADLEYCGKSYTQKCFDPNMGQKSIGRKAFDQCCKSCFAAVSKNTCTWSVDNAGKTLPGQFDYYGVPCFDVCDSINQVKQAEDLCDPVKQQKMEAKCVYAAADIRKRIEDYKVKNGGEDWCKSR